MPSVSELESVTLMAEIQPETAKKEITRAVSARHKIARGYVMRLRKRNPEALPAEIIATLERHYVTAITLTGGVVTAGTIAANVGIALIPGVAAGKEAGKGAAKVAAKGAAKTVAAKAAANAAAKSAAKPRSTDEGLGVSGSERENALTCWKNCDFSRVQFAPERRASRRCNSATRLARPLRCSMIRISCRRPGLSRSWRWPDLRGSVSWPGNT